jgi:hypothetical protein
LDAFVRGRVVGALYKRYARSANYGTCPSCIDGSQKAVAFCPSDRGWLLGFTKAALALLTPASDAVAAACGRLMSQMDQKQQVSDCNNSSSFPKSGLAWVQTTWIIE